MSEGPNIGIARGVGNTGVVVGDTTDPSCSTAFVRVMTVGLNMPGAIAEDTLCDLGTPLCRVPCMHAPFTVGVLVFRAVLPPIGEISDACVEYSGGDVGRDRSIMKDARFESSICIGTGQCM